MRLHAQNDLTGTFGLDFYPIVVKILIKMFPYFKNWQKKMQIYVFFQSTTVRQT